MKPKNTIHKSLKFRISLWYAFLFTLMLGGSLYVSYEIISLQLKQEIIADVLAKKQHIQSIVLNPDSEEHHGEEKREHHRRKKKEHGEQKRGNLFQQVFNNNFQHVLLSTEQANENYLLLIYHNQTLVYSTPTYHYLENTFRKYQPTLHKTIYLKLENAAFTMSSFQHRQFDIYIAYNLQPLKNLQSKLIHIFLLVFPISLVLSVLCGFFVTQRSMNIIKEISRTAKMITSSNLSKRIAGNNSKDEIGELIDTLNTMVERLEASFHMAKEFSQDAAHEIKTPLTIIRGEIESLIEKNREETTTNALENILEEVQYMSSISERLLLIHNMDTNQLKYHFEEINLSQLLQEVDQDVQIMAMGKNISVDYQIQEGVFLKGNRELITRLLWNLNDNAIKYNKEKGSIQLRLLQEKEQITIEVKDSGIGIPEADLSKIFNRFYRVDQSRSRKLGGSGLGLSICRWIVDLHGGSIHVESKLNQGSTFILYFPVVPS